MGRQDDLMRLRKQNDLKNEDLRRIGGYNIFKLKEKNLSKKKKRGEKITLGWFRKLYFFSRVFLLRQIIIF